MVTLVRTSARSKPVLFCDEVGMPPDRPPSYHCLGPGDMPLEAKASGHVAVLIPEVAVSSLVAVCAG